MSSSQVSRLASGFNNNNNKTFSPKQVRVG
uniref:Uncharacterized protein n=1 Tax=Arundo donax TaxID=35708 RepID=A0A0A9H0J0_ARUDO